MNEKMSRKVAIIILNYNGWRDTVECLESVQTLDYPYYLTIVVDNGSTDGSIEKIKAWARGELEVKSEYIKYNPKNKPVQVIEYDREAAENGGIPELEAELSERPSDRKLVLIKNRENLGYSAGNNVGIRYAIIRNIEAVLITNPDIVFEDNNLLTFMMHAVFDKSDVVAVGPKVININGQMQNPMYEPTFWGEFLSPYFGFIRDSIWKRKLKNLSFKKHPVEAEKLVGCCMLIRTNFLNQINLLDENVFLYCEEAILAAQIRNKGKKMMYDPRCKVRHTGGTGNVSIFLNSRKYYLKNYKHYGSIKMALISLTHYMIKLKHSMVKK